MTAVLPAREAWPSLAPAPGTPVWDAFCDIRMLATAGYALVLQVAHPTVGAGVANASGCRSTACARRRSARRAWG